jgi:protoporphyrin/coproporphyrin ferrochelatase
VKHYDERVTDIDSILVVSFGGPEQAGDIMPFLRNVTTGRNVPDERLARVAEQYQAIGGRSPINDQARALIAALKPELAARNIALPIYWGNRNWAPYLSDAVQDMKNDGRRHAVAFVTSAYSSYSSCRQYRENIAAAQSEAGSDAPIINKIGQFYDRPGFVDPFVRNTRDALERINGSTALVFTAHSIPTAMAQHARYEAQLIQVASTIANAFDNRYPWSLSYQSRSGAPHVPWLEPDINDKLASLAKDGVENVVVIPIGFVSDHVEVMYDLDLQAQKTATDLGIHMQRVATPGTDPQFISMITDLISEELAGENTNRCLGDTCCLVGTH